MKKRLYYFHFLFYYGFTALPAKKWKPIDMNQKPIFIFGPHKSGTSLLRSLLDGHPDLFSIPIESHVFSGMGMGIRYEKKKQNDSQWPAHNKKNAQ